jgi:hypothetical protein
LPLFALALASEFAALFVYFQERGTEVFGLQAAVSGARDWVARRRAERAVAALALPPGERIYAALYSDDGRPLLAAFEEEYESAFAELAADVRSDGARLVVLYVPPTVPGPVSATVDAHDRGFFSALSSRHDAVFVDATPAFAPYPHDRVALLPENLHLARFGNQLLCDALVPILEELRDHRARARHVRRPRLLGDLPPCSRRLSEHEHFPARVAVNCQGLRGREVRFPKTSQRILLLGDSFTFGIYLPEAHTYGAILEHRLDGREIINAGVPGYTILQERDLYRERARFVDPDIVVLQVLFNDLYGLFFFERAFYVRRGRWLYGTRQGQDEEAVEPGARLPAGPRRPFVTRPAAALTARR